MKSANSNTITLNKMRFFAYHGVYKEERQNGGWYTVSLQFSVDVEKAAQTDDIADAIDYTTLYQIVKKEMAIPAKLIESLACRISQKLKQSQSLKNGLLTIAKEQPPIDGNIESVIITIGI